MAFTTDPFWISFNAKLEWPVERPNPTVTVDALDTTIHEECDKNPSNFEGAERGGCREMVREPKKVGD